MKELPAFKKIYENMKPGVISAQGFLGDDTRKLEEIITADENEMIHLSLSFNKTAQVMRHFLSEGRKGLGEEITVHQKWRVFTRESRGLFPCPYEDGSERKVNVSVTLVEGGTTLVYTSLSIHLLEKHHFLQGKGAFFRLEPQVILNVFGTFWE